jgi:hypothetical protein
MMLSNAEQAAAKAKVPAASWALRANGPILTSHILTFGAKLGLALHFELHKRPVPISGGVLPIWFSNAQAVKGEIPTNLLAMLPAPRTMTQGRKNVRDQFQYSLRPMNRTTRFCMRCFGNLSPSPRPLQMTEPSS